MTDSQIPAASHKPSLPPFTPSSPSHSDGYFSSSNQPHQKFSPPSLPTSSAPSTSLPPPQPTLLHSYHHPITASYAPSSSFFDRNRHPPPSLRTEHRSPPLEHSSSQVSASSFSRVLPPLSSSASSANAFHLPSLSASLPSSTSWHGRESQHQPGINGAHASTFRASSDAFSAESRRPAHDSKLRPLTGHFADLHNPRPPSADPFSAGLLSPNLEELSHVTRKPAKAHVPSACLNCKRAHLACDVGRPCRRCVNLGKSDTCIDVQHKKRGRPRLKDRPSSQAGITTLQTLDAKSDVSGSPASASYARQSPSSESGYFRSPTRATELLSPPLLSSSTVMHVSGRTHGPGAHPRSASNSVSASSYPFSRPDHLPLPIDLGSQPAGYATPSWSYQQNGSHASEPFGEPFGKPTTAHPMSGRHHANSLSYEQQHHSVGHRAFQPSPSPHRGGSASDTSGGVVSAVVTMICSTNLQCARISDECTALLGYQPSELNERSLFELVHPSETSRLQEIWTSLIDPVGVVPQSVPAAAEVVMSTPAARLMTPASGTIFVQENMRLRQRNGMYDFYSVRLHLGGGFGVDLYRRETLDRAYIVASLLKLGNDAVHPDPAILRSPYTHDSAHTQGFRTPSGPSASAPPRPARWEAEPASVRASHASEQHQCTRSESVNQPPAHLDTDMRRDQAAQPNVEAGDASRQETSRGVKRSSAEMVQDKPALSSRPAPALAASHAVAGAAHASYSPSKHTTCSPPPVVRSMLSERARGTSRDGILC